MISKSKAESLRLVRELSTKALNGTLDKWETQTLAKHALFLAYNAEEDAEAWRKLLNDIRGAITANRITKAYELLDKELGVDNV